MIIGTVRILPPPSRHAAVIEVLRSVQESVRTQPGCAAFDILEEMGPEPAIVLFERWESGDALEEHLRSESCRRVLGAVDLAGGRPETRFEHVSASEGFELVERLRTPNGRVSS
jgi:quinol monooxygenase YgiN